MATKNKVGEKKDPTKNLEKASSKNSQPKNDIILFVHKVTRSMVEEIRAYQKENKRKFRVALICDIKNDPNAKKRASRSEEFCDIVLTCDGNSDSSIHKALKPIRDEIFAVTTRGDDAVPLLAKMVPHIPYVLTPTRESLYWSTEKVVMRERLRDFSKSLVPKFMVIDSVTKKTVTSIAKEIGFPLIVKPSGLGASRLVSICYHQEELLSVLKKTFKVLQKTYKETDGRGEPTVLIEQFMEGSMYSIDAYVDAKGRATFCPTVFVKTGREIGFDDFFGYSQMTPSILKKENLEIVQETALKAIHALGLRNTSAHVELMRTEHSWKVIELGPRLGGFRHEMHELTHGINHTMNDILNRAGEKVSVPKKQKGYAVAMKFFAKKEGYLKKLKGIKKAQDLKSFHHISINKNLGDRCRYAKHGGSSVFNIILFNKDRSSLLADIRRLEQMISIDVK